MALLLAAGCSDSPSSPQPAAHTPDDPVLVVLVPGFMSEFYEAVSVYAEEELCDAVRDGARVLNFELPLVGTVPLGDRVAQALPCLDVLPNGGLVSFATQMSWFDDQGVAYHNMTAEAGFNSEESVEHNAAAIAAYLAGVEGHRVILVSHSKGGLDALHALITHPELWNAPVVGWVALQAPFAGSPVADLMPARLSSLLLAALGGNGESLTDLEVAGRAGYMQEHAGVIADLTARIPVKVCRSSYTAPAPLSSVVDGVAAQVFTSGFIAEAVEIAKTKIAAYPLDFPRALSESVSAVVALVQTRARNAAQAKLATLGMMDTTNRAMNLQGIPNDGLVPMASAVLPGALSEDLRPAGDHAAPVMITAPLKEFWSTAHRDTTTLDLVDETLALTGGDPRRGGE